MQPGTIHLQDGVCLSCIQEIALIPPKKGTAQYCASTLARPHVSLGAFVSLRFSPLSSHPFLIFGQFRSPLFSLAEQ